MQTTTTPTNADLARHARVALEQAGIDSDQAADIVGRMHPRGHYELTTVLTDDPDALHWMSTIWQHMLADRFRFRSEADAATAQRLIRDALAATR